ncbi:histone deacetylase [Streptomyces clavuligerus]|uniref:Class II RPD3 type histone deacetylase protein n=1 Tax=Streptomyces clavuligerus TaxID=1901 RepID=B5GT38_STRCL|nr:hypothetical protein [Streptomyces clavuligerus]ANW19077.1 histone deacetylase [Streptomyces clavuligerus]AXU13659.1 histone deacetylase [Streptomyces clavuligerus]EDY49484.1 conserved hypothetical protein [Streptomyces clavuligerus]EFG08188.1 class II RPD3 type histone deacetylase protein [Streptomyces clavuligerus]MBY6303629.1 histone deacetylase [Streptomyces clavuligerus]
MTPRTVHRPGPRPPVSVEPEESDRVWYVAYGSNMDPARLRRYLRGGRAPGAARSHPGCRNPADPVRTVSVELPGLLYFATESPVWTGGSAFYDPSPGPGHPGSPVLARAHLVTAGQFRDIAAQEARRPPGWCPGLREVIGTGRARAAAPARYGTLLCPGSLNGVPLLTVTGPWSWTEAALNSPSAVYLRHLAVGLLAAGTWDGGCVARYLAGAPGAAGAWTPGAVRALTAV